jgi:protein-tyrosine phosphatase
VQVTLPGGIVVLARGRLDPDPPARAPDFALYLDRRWEDDPEVTWPFHSVDWPDFGLPADEPATFAAIVDLYRRAREGKLVEVACYGGVGRTGTVLGCLAAFAGVPRAAAVSWVREHYHPAAVETDDQAQLIDRFAQWSGCP